ncbi:MAG TPA: tRNA pseudouridine(55) synthase TruB, partial [Fimbriimonadaceae bacterium]|nr:tRNA pseudouridine(55) synthase TruB [Fimbriimonadaceae bacterium]
MRRRFGTRRVGHAGTLDPLASGLLVVAVGPATRFLQYLSLEPKEYLADVRFGHATSTYDAEGVPTESGPVPEDLPAALEGVLPAFRGLIQQLPPMYSAVKLNGKPLYTYARRGEEVERRPRTVHIDELTVMDERATDHKLPERATAQRAVHPDEAQGVGYARLKIRCSGGTYVRTLAHDIGAALGCGAHLVGLVRTQVGRFYLTAAKKLEEVGPDDLIPLGEALAPMPPIQLDEASERHARDGRMLAFEAAQVPDSPLAVLLDLKGGIVGVGRVTGHTVHPECVLPREAAPAV